MWQASRGIEEGVRRNLNMLFNIVNSCNGKFSQPLYAQHINCPSFCYGHFVCAVPITEPHASMEKTQPADVGKNQDYSNR